MKRLQYTRDSRQRRRREFTDIPLRGFVASGDATSSFEGFKFSIHTQQMRSIKLVSLILVIIGTFMALTRLLVNEYVLVMFLSFAHYCLRICQKMTPKLVAVISKVTSGWHDFRRFFL